MMNQLTSGMLSRLAPRRKTVTKKAAAKSGKIAAATHAAGVAPPRSELGTRAVRGVLMAVEAEFANMAPSSLPDAYVFNSSGDRVVSAREVVAVARRFLAAMPSDVTHAELVLARDVDAKNAMRSSAWEQELILWTEARLSRRASGLLRQPVPDSEAPALNLSPRQRKQILALVGKSAAPASVSVPTSRVRRSSTGRTRRVKSSSQAPVSASPRHSVAEHAPVVRRSSAAAQDEFSAGVPPVLPACRPSFTSTKPEDTTAAAELVRRRRHRTSSITLLPSAEEEVQASPVDAPVVPKIVIAPPESLRGPPTMRSRSAPTTLAPRSMNDGRSTSPKHKSKDDLTVRFISWDE